MGGLAGSSETKLVGRHKAVEELLHCLHDEEADRYDR